MKTKRKAKERGPWRVDWFDAKYRIRSEWFLTKKKAFAREAELWKERIDASCFYEN